VGFVCDSPPVRAPPRGRICSILRNELFRPTYSAHKGRCIGVAYVISMLLCGAMLLCRATSGTAEQQQRPSRFAQRLSPLISVRSDLGHCRRLGFVADEIKLGAAPIAQRHEVPMLNAVTHERMVVSRQRTPHARTLSVPHGASHAACAGCESGVRGAALRRATLAATWPSNRCSGL